MICGHCKESHETVDEARACATYEARAARICGRKVTMPSHVAHPDRDFITRDGMYGIDGNVVKVQRAVHGSGNLYARLLNPDTGKFTYQKGLIFRLRDSMRMSLDEAKAFGALYGRCCVCGALLTNEDSINAGIGPVCAGRLAA